VYEKILVPLDGSELAECVLPHVENLAKDKKAVKVVLVRVVEPKIMPYSEYDTGVIATEIMKEEELEKVSAREYLEKVATNLTKSGIQTETHMLSGNAAEELINFIDKNGIKLVVIATHGRSGVNRWIWGSTTDRILHHVSVPIFVIRAPGCIEGMK
jgi:nucleotide-binding universal stress UspA family protein